MAHQVFISYATEDHDTASGVCALLEADGIQCWLASRDATESEDRAAAILEAIRNSDLVLLIFSASANASPTVLRDVERAISYERPVLSLHLDDSLPNPSLEYYLNLWQWLDASAGVEDKGEDIVAAVREQLAGASDSGPWQGLDAPGGVDTIQEEILVAVRGHLAQTATSARTQEPDAAAASRRRSSRRTWAIARGAALPVLALALGLGLGLGLGQTGVVHRGTWTKLDPAGTVSHEVIAPMTYDSSTGRPIIMVGYEEEDPDSASIARSIVGTWAYDAAANTWAELKPSETTSPPCIAAFAMAYDPTAQRFIVFGGYDRETQISPEEWTLHRTANTWAYDPSANTWTELKPAGTVPSARIEGATAYDPTTGRLILFGGGADVAFLGDTWAYDPVANTWTELKPAGSVPPARSSKMVYDPSTGRMIMFGGMSDTGVLNDTWAYDPVANTWTDLDPSGTLPRKRLGFAMTYDSSGHRVLVFGGAVFDFSKFFNDTWAYDPSANTWTELKPAGTLPGARIASMAYDATTGQVIMFGGRAPGIEAKRTLNDTWAFTP